MKRPVVQPARLERLTDDQLADVLKRYPWFDTARLILQSRTTAEDPQLRLRLQIAGWPEILLARPDTARSEADVIDRFLSREFRRIVPDPASFPAGEDLAREWSAKIPNSSRKSWPTSMRGRGFTPKRKRFMPD